MIDVLVEPEPLDKLGEEFGFNGEGQYCHSGVLGCAKHIYSDLQRYVFQTKMYMTGLQYLLSIHM